VQVESFKENLSPKASQSIPIYLANRSILSASFPDNLKPSPSTQKVPRMFLSKLSIIILWLRVVVFFGQMRYIPYLGLTFK